MVIQSHHHHRSCGVEHIDLLPSHKCSWCRCCHLGTLLVRMSKHHCCRLPLGISWVVGICLPLCIQLLDHKSRPCMDHQSHIASLSHCIGLLWQHKMTHGTCHVGCKPLVEVVSSTSSLELECPQGSCSMCTMCHHHSPLVMCKLSTCTHHSSLHHMLCYPSHQHHKLWRQFHQHSE